MEYRGGVRLLNPRAWRFIPFAAAPLAAVVAADFLTEEQTRQVLFPEAERFDDRPVTSAALRAAVKKTGAPPWDAVPRVWSALRRGSVLGYVVVDHVIGKHDFITYAVGISSGGVVRGVEILRYRESHGGDVRNERWRRQFVGRGREKPLRFGIDIKNIAGATLSCRHVTEGVRLVLALSEDWNG